MMMLLIRANGGVTSGVKHFIPVTQVNQSTICMKKTPGTNLPFSFKYSPALKARGFSEPCPNTCERPTRIIYSMSTPTVVSAKTSERYCVHPVSRLLSIKAHQQPAACFKESRQKSRQRRFGVSCRSFLTKRAPAHVQVMLTPTARCKAPGRGKQRLSMAMV